MLTRIVKSDFKHGNIDSFMQIFEETKQYILDFEGCISLELFQDLENPNIFFTYSKWKSKKYLELYRSSDFFKKVWGKTKLLFNEKPEAWSVHKK